MELNNNELEKVSGGEVIELKDGKFGVGVIFKTFDSKEAAEEYDKKHHKPHHPKKPHKPFSHTLPSPQKPEDIPALIPEHVEPIDPKNDTKE